MSDETQDSARQLERVPFRHSLAEVDEIQNPYLIGAPGMNRTCDLRFRKPTKCVHLDLTSSANPYFVHNSDQLVPTSPRTNLSVCATSV